jgi:TonB-linked SusC/RagA family outer membrane protein
MKTKFNGFLTLLLALIVQFTFAQERTVTGKVTDVNGGPLPGVTVVVKNTVIGTQTDFDGNYSIKASTGDVLQFTYVGMNTLDITVGTSNVINGTMKEGAEMLEEIVITALGITREKREVTYQTAQVNDKELVAAAPTRAASALAGKVAGLQINVQDNGVNPSNQILLRGLRSVSGNNSALIVIDGSIATQGAFDDLNPLDIEDISVLKGATAAALYGSNAGNGALLVTTKKGKASGKITVGINSTYTAETVAYMPEFQSEYGTGWEGAYNPIENTNWGPRFDGTLRQIGPTFPADYGLATQMVPYAPVENNMLDFFETGDTFNNTVYLSASDENSSMYISIGDQRTDGIVPDDTYTRNTIRANGQKTIGNVTLTANSSFFKDNTDIVGSTIGDQDRPLYWFILNTATNIPLSSYSDWQDPKGYGYADNYFNGYYQNPYWGIGTNRNTDESNRFVGNVNVSWDIKEWLNFTGRLGANNAWGSGKNWRDAQTYNAELQPSAGAVSSFVEDSEFQSAVYTGDFFFNGDFDYKEDFTLNATVGGNFYQYAFRNSLIRANNLSIPGFYDISNGTGTPEVTADGEEKRTYGFFADLSFGYKNYLFLNLSGRNDWTSTLAPENNSYFYPAIGVSFVFTDAFTALQNNDILSYGKFTYSNSTVYNDLNAYRINETYSQAPGFSYGSINGFELNPTAVDANIEKEKINTNEFGLNLGFFKGRLSLDASYYNTITSNLITFTTPSVASASTAFLTNIGELQSSGFELTVGGTIINKNDWNWNLNVNYTNSKTVVNSITPDLDEVAITTTGQYGIYAVVGENYPQIKANVYERDSQGRIVVDAASGSPIQQDGLANMGQTTPKYIIGLNTVLSWKSLTFSATTDYRTGHVYYEQGSDAMEFTGRSVASVSANRQDFVIPNSVIETSPGVYVENTNIQVSGGRQSYWTDVYNDVKSNYVKDATAFKIREVALSYALPQEYLTNIFFSRVSVGVVGRNVFTRLPEENRFSDPEFNNTNSNAIGIGGYFQAPPTKTWGFNVNLEF